MRYASLIAIVFTQVIACGLAAFHLDGMGFRNAYRAPPRAEPSEAARVTTPVDPVQSATADEDSSEPPPATLRPPRLLAAAQRNAIMELNKAFVDF